MIDVRIPYAASGNLGEAYRETFRSTKKPWVLILDHDVLILHPNWYHVCMEAIKNHPDAGEFTCWTNVIGGAQLDREAPGLNVSIPEQRKYARKVWDKYQYQCTLLNRKEQPISGFFMLIKTEAFNKVSCLDGFFHVDWDLKNRLVGAGYSTYRIDGLYAYHFRDRCPSWIGGIKVSNDYRGK